MTLNQIATHIKIPLDSVRETGNVRRTYDEDGIRELAESIKHNGLLNPVTVKPAEEDADGNKTYELIAGHRRIRAYRYLLEQGDDFSMIEACIRTGKKLILQIIENIQRTDITPREKEDAIAQMLAENYTQTDIARELSKPIQWVSDIVAGAKVRKVADYHGFDTENIATKTLSQLRTIPEDELYAPLEQLVMRGGTMKAATDILHEWKEAPIYQFHEHQEEMRQLAEKMLTTNESSSEDSEEQSEAYSEDENMIEPHEMTEAEWKDDNLPNGLKIGDYVQGLGKRLHYSDLSVGSVFIKNASTESRKLYQLCKVLAFNDFEQFDYDDGDYMPSLGYSFSNKNEVDGDDPYDWIYKVTENTSLAPDKPSEGNDEWDDENECFLAPKELSDEHEYFAPGTIISHAGKRLFFADLYVGKEFVHANDKNSAQHLKVCKVSKIGDDCFEYIDGDRCCGEYSSSRKKYIDSEVCEHNDWIYEIPDDAVAVKVPDMQPVKTEPKPQKILQNSDEIPVINLPSEQPLTVGMLMNELQKIPQSNFVVIKANGNLYEVHYVSIKKNNVLLTTYADTRYQKL